MTTKLVSRQSTTIGDYNTSNVEINIPAHDTDIDLTLPNGDRIVLQFRLESNTLDVLLPQNLEVHNWLGSDMTPAPKVARNKFQHIRRCDQLCVQLPPKALG